MYTATVQAHTQNFEPAYSPLDTFTATVQAHTQNFEHSPLDTHTASTHIAHNYISVMSVVKT